MELNKALVFRENIWHSVSGLRQELRADLAARADADKAEERAGC